MSPMRFSHRLLLVGLALLWKVAAQTNLVRNPSFEAGLQPWTNVGPGSWYPTSGPNARSGEYLLGTTSSDDAPAALSQTVQGATRLTCYKITFYSYCQGGSGLSDCAIAASFGDGSVGYLFPGNRFTQTILYGRATVADGPISIRGYNNPGTLFLDDVSVTSATLEEQINCTPVASGQMRRRSIPKQTVLDWCTARANHHECPIEAGSLNTICVDTSAEIEYCGDDCMNCLAIEGAFEVGCEQGKCVVMSCEGGYTMQGEACIRRA